MRTIAISAFGVIALSTLTLAACDERARPNAGGDVERGRASIETRGCGACHEIPGVRGARGRVAAPLSHFAQRTFIVGEVPNDPERLVDWVMHPRALRPKTAMPELGIDTAEARDIAAYLYTLDER